MPTQSSHSSSADSCCLPSAPAGAEPSAVRTDSGLLAVPSNAAFSNLHGNLHGGVKLTNVNGLVTSQNNVLFLFPLKTQLNVYQHTMASVITNILHTCSVA